MLQISNNQYTSFKNGMLFNTTMSVESNAVLNRAILEGGAIEVPNALAANNPDEAKERILRGGLYFVAAFLSPFLFLPVINRTALKSTGIIKHFSSKEAHIMKVPKEFLAENAEKMQEGIKKTGKELGLEKEFQNILNRFSDKEELRKKLIKAHKRTLFTDIATTSVMASSIPWLGNMYTEWKTNRKGYVGEFEMADRNYTDKKSKEHEDKKNKKMALSMLSSLIPAFIIPPMVSKALETAPDKIKSKTLQWTKKNAKLFNYKNGMFMSRAIYAGITLLGNFPSYLLACRDKNELKYKFVQWVTLCSFFFGGDLLLNNVFGRTLDKTVGTKMMDNEKLKTTKGFFRRLFVQPKSLEELSKDKSMPKSLLRKTKRTAVGMYWGNLVLTGLSMGFGLPIILNKVLKNDVEKDLKAQTKN